ncbi:MAG TPA: elongation factor P maturation arginine rhamnosyltransferase EarP, partial [Burkholderiaceae bacterium]|nr:elongation factor P maturation arginine rhamnosyltransferase EarP [Burkholderiaceae bacterium]
LLWSSDLNLVRGEDSLVRAIWAGKPLIWHIYPQDENTHMDKLDAWLRLASYPAEADAGLRAWNAGDTPAFRDSLEQTLQPATWARWQAASGRWAGSLAQSSGLAQALLAFCAKYRQTR